MLSPTLHGSQNLMNQKYPYFTTVASSPILLVIDIVWKKVTEISGASLAL